MSIQICGTGSYLPPLAVDNNKLAEIMDTSDEWIQRRVGIVERRISEDETVVQMAIKAAEAAVKDAGINPEDIDLLLFTSVSSELLCPSNAAVIQKAIGATCPAFDMNTACSGFVFALQTAAAYMSVPGYECVLIVSAERMSKVVNWEDRGSCVIFGDGAGAAVVRRGEGLLSCHLHTEGDDKTLYIPIGENASPFWKGETPKMVLTMLGQDTFQFAVKRMERDITKVVADAGLTMDDIDWVIPHQANLRIISYASKRLGIPMEKFMVNIQKVGNVSSASEPIALDELVKSGKLKRGQILVLSAFGGGLSSGACVIRY